MTNDKDIDVLMRHHAKGKANDHGDVAHLDADELNAFAEGALPPPARQRYMSHLADCDSCRKLASQLMIFGGQAGEAPVAASRNATQSWWHRLSTLVGVPALRYAAFAALLVAVVGISFLVWRRPASRNAELIAQNQPQAAPAEALKPSTSGSSHAREAQAENTIAKAVPQGTVERSLGQKTDETTTVNAAPPPKTEADKLAPAARMAEAPRSEASPSYAPAPPVETYRADDRAREQQNLKEPTPSGPRRNESYDKYKALDRARSADLAKERDEERTRATQPARAENKPETATKTAQTSAGAISIRGRSVQETRTETSKAEKAAGSEEAPETRSVGGRKFRRQGNAWVDAKFKASMSVRTVTRGSEDFEKLDSRLRSIAQQLSGEIVVVWKGKAYRIK